MRGMRLWDQRSFAFDCMLAEAARLGGEAEGAGSIARGGSDGEEETRGVGGAFAKVSARCGAGGGACGRGSRGS
eukprot:13620545-Heterocapsa_arctica.AAC.1